MPAGPVLGIPHDSEEMMGLSILLAGPAALVLFAAVAVAEEAPPKSTHVTVDLGYVNTAGNSEVQTFSGSEKLEALHGVWKLTLDADAIWGSDHGVENAGRYLAGLRGDRYLGSRHSIYALGAWRRNSFAGIERQFDEVVGFALHELIRKPQQLDLEVGVGLQAGEDQLQRSSSAPTREAFGTGTLAAHYRYYFREGTYLEVNGRYLHNLKQSIDYEWITRVALVAPLTDNLALNLGHDYTYRSIPLNGFKLWDSTFVAGVQINW
jgi:putative salt-induced outer membrane protein YdiY